MVDRYRILALAALAAAAGCRGAPVRGGNMLELSTALPPLSAAVEAAIGDRDRPPDLGDAELVARATRHDPSLAAPFSGYALRVAREDRHAVVLVCTADRRIALLEDAGCSERLDRRHWDASPPAPCEFTIRAREACAAPAAKKKLDCVCGGG